MAVCDFFCKNTNPTRERDQQQVSANQNPSPEVSLIVPVYNEEKNVPLLYDAIIAAMKDVDHYEVIMVDDGSTDNSPNIIAALAEKDTRIKMLQFRKNFGQTAAMAAGIDHASGSILIPLDADMQNDPADIPAMLKKLDEGYDLVSGWRKSRKDPFFTRKVPSVIANKIISFITKVPIHDFGCTLKAYRREIIEDVKLYGEMHRLIPAYAMWRGAKVTEMVVNHHPRKHGVTKYGLERTLKVVLDLITVKFLGSFVTKPSYLFGGMGILCFLGAFASGMATILRKVIWGEPMITTPLLLLTVLLLVLGVQLILIGLLAELMVRIYHESQMKQTYYIKRTINVDRPKNEVKEAS